MLHALNLATRHVAARLATLDCGKPTFGDGQPRVRIHTQLPYLARALPILRDLGAKSLGSKCFYYWHLWFVKPIGEEIT